MEVYSILSAVRETMLWVYSVFVLVFLFRTKILLLVPFWSVCLSCHLRILYVYLYSHCRLQYLYRMTFSLWYSHIVRCWLCITNFIHSLTFNIFLVLFNLCILFHVDCIVIINLYVFSKYSSSYSSISSSASKSSSWYSFS